MQSHTVVSAYVTSEHIPPFDFSDLNTPKCGKAGARICFCVQITPVLEEDY